MNTEYKLMVIDDDITSLTSSENILVEAGYTVSVFKSGTQAISAIKAGLCPDLILLDIAMPDMNGYDTFTHIREHINTPIIFLTGADDTASELTGLKLGALDYITKPFVKDILLARINAHLSTIDLYKNAASAANVAAEFDSDKLASMEKLLTESEYNVGKLIAMGYSNQEIAEQLCFSYSYVKKIAYRIFDKLDISKRYEIRDFFLK